MNHTHYHRPTKTWFSLESCENCGRLIQAPNACTLHNPESVPGLQYVDSLPGEGWHSDDAGGEVCDGCADDARLDAENDPEFACGVEPAVKTVTCQWFLLCENEATTTEPHPVLGAVPICGRCADKVARLGSAS